MQTTKESSRGKRADLLRWLERVRPARIGEMEWAMLHVDLAPISGSHLRRLLRESGVPLAPLVEGVRQENFRSAGIQFVELPGRNMNAATSRPNDRFAGW